MLKQPDPIEQLNAAVGDVLAEAMETMAFVSALLAEGPVEAAPAPASAVLLRMPFRGPISGTVEMVAAAELGRLLAGNILPPGSVEQDSPLAGDDALKELLNVTCGALFHGASIVVPSSATGTAGAGFDIALPQLDRFDDAADWRRFVSVRGTTVLDAEGSLVAIRVQAA